MKHFFNGLNYFLLAPIALWLLCASFALLVEFSYSDHILSWIPFIILGGWVPGKWYGLTLVHSIICVAVSFGVISFFDKRIELREKTRIVLLLLTVALFVYETIFNFFFRGTTNEEIEQFRQLASLQLSFIIGILIKTFNKGAEM